MSTSVPGTYGGNNFSERRLAVQRGDLIYLSQEEDSNPGEADEHASLNKTRRCPGTQYLNLRLSLQL